MIWFAETSPDSQGISLILLLVHIPVERAIVTDMYLEKDGITTHQVLQFVIRSSFPSIPVSIKLSFLSKNIGCVASNEGKELNFDE